jgi:hypothetical protein
MSVPPPRLPAPAAARLELAISVERLANYRIECDGDLSAAIELYRWNSDLSAACWQTLGHVEVFLRNVLADRLDARQRRRGRTTSWLADPTVGLDQRGLDDVATAYRRVRAKGKPPRPGQVMTELSFGFWRFLLARRYQTMLWPDLAAGFPHAPTRDRKAVEEPVAALHQFRNRLAHHERIWNEPVQSRYEDCLLVAGYIDPTVHDWIAAASRVPVVLADRP